MLLNEQPFLSSLCLFLLRKSCKNQPRASERNVVDVVYDIMRQGKSVLPWLPPAPLLNEAMIALTRFLWVCQFWNLTNNVWEFVYLRLNSSCAFILICSPAPRGQKNWWVCDFTWYLRVCDFTPRNKSLPWSRRRGKESSWAQLAMLRPHIEQLSKEWRLVAVGGCEAERTGKSDEEEGR